MAARMWSATALCLLTAVLVSGSALAGEPGWTVNPLEHGYGDQGSLGQAGLIAWWSFNEGSGTVVHDSSGHGNDAINHGGAWTPGGMIFSDPTDIVEYIPGSFDDPVTNAFSVSAQLTWNGSCYMGTYGLILDARSSSSGFALSIFPDSTLHFNLYQSGGGVAVSGQRKVPVNTPVHLAVVVETTTQTTIRLFVQGVFDTSMTTPCSYVPTTIPAAIGNNRWWPDGSYRPFLGTMDDLKVYNRALSAAEVAAQADQGWWDTSWRYRKPLQISSPAESYQMLLRVFKEDGHDAPAQGTIDCENNCRDDFGDLRFVANSGLLLPYWIQETGVVGGDHYADVWVETPGTEAVDLYYGNDGAASADDGSATFPYHDHWAADHTNQWLAGVPEVNHYCRWENVHSFSTYRAVEIRTRLTQWSAGLWDYNALGWCAARSGDPRDTNHVAVVFCMRTAEGASSTVVLTRLEMSNGAAYYQGPNHSVARPDPSHVLSMSLRYAADRVSFVWEDLTTGQQLVSIENTDAAYIPDPTTIPYFYSDELDYGGGIFSWQSPTSLNWGNQTVNGACNFRHDWWFVRNYVSQQPSWAAFGTQRILAISGVAEDQPSYESPSVPFLSCQPVPFRDVSQVELALPQGGDVRLLVFDVAGRQVRTLLRGNYPVGRHVALWNGKDDGGREVAPGAYFVRLQAPGTRQVVRVVKLD